MQAEKASTMIQSLLSCRGTYDENAMDQIRLKMGRYGLRSSFVHHSKIFVCALFRRLTADITQKKRVRLKQFIILAVGVIAVSSSLLRYDSSMVRADGSIGLTKNTTESRATLEQYRTDSESQQSTINQALLHDSMTHWKLIGTNPIIGDAYNSSSERDYNQIPSQSLWHLRTIPQPEPSPWTWVKDCVRERGEDRGTRSWLVACGGGRHFHARAWRFVHFLHHSRTESSEPSFKSFHGANHDHCTMLGSWEQIRTQLCACHREWLRTQEGA
jgi:hypothetical protein